jgi:hypothetical protein
MRPSKRVTGLKSNDLCRHGPNHEIRISPCRCVASPDSPFLALRHRYPRPGRGTLRGTLAGGDRPSRDPVPHIAAHHNPVRVRVSAVRCRSGLAMSLLRGARSGVRPHAGHLPAAAACVVV